MTDQGPDTPPPIGRAYPEGHSQAPKPGVIPLRPIVLSEIIDGAITTIRRYPALMLGLTAIIVTISEVISLLATLPLLSLDVDPFDPASVDAIDDAAFAGALGAQAITGVLTGLAGLILTGVLTAVVGKAVLGQHTSFREVWAAVKPSVARLIGLAVLLMSVLIVGLIAIMATFFVHPLLGVLVLVVGFAAALWLYVALALAVPALVLERATVMGALRRSYALVKGSWWRVFGILLVVLLIVVVLSTILQIPFFLAGMFAGEATGSLLVATVLGSIGAILASLLVYPVGAATVALLYTDQRMRREGLDIELARRAGGAPSGPAGPGSTP